MCNLYLYYQKESQEFHFTASDAKGEIIQVPDLFQLTAAVERKQVFPPQFYDST